MEFKINDRVLVHKKYLGIVRKIFNHNYLIEFLNKSDGNNFIKDIEYTNYYPFRFTSLTLYNKPKNHLPKWW
jgi:hypothetical protein